MGSQAWPHAPVLESELSPPHGAGIDLLRVLMRGTWYSARKAAFACALGMKELWRFYGSCEPFISFSSLLLHSVN